MAKMTPQQKSSALQVAAQLGSAITVRGTLPSDKEARNTCLTALRLASHMDKVISMVESNDDLMTLPLKEAYLVLNQTYLDVAVADESEEDTTSKPAKDSGTTSGK